MEPKKAGIHSCHLKKPPLHILPVIVLSQFAGTSLWFTGNAILPAMEASLPHLNLNVGNVTSLVQGGFIAGTLCFALLGIADRFKPSIIFLASCLLSALANYSILFWHDSAESILLLRFTTGFFLAGIYPVGMKIAADWYAGNLSKALGFLVGALVAGKSLPYLLAAFPQLSWETVLSATSFFALFGGVLLFITIPDGPYRLKAARTEWSAMFKVFRQTKFRDAATGYFGHMWELYAFWAFVPVWIALYAALHSTPLQTSLWSFVIIAVGSVSCVVGGYFSQRLGSARVAYVTLSLSALCALFAPVAFYLIPALFLAYMVFWGIVVIADSPQFSTLVAQTADPLVRGTGITVVVSLGFALTIVSISLMQWLIEHYAADHRWFIPLLAIGPFLGITSTRKFLKVRR